jgi:hypothetical protein
MSVTMVTTGTRRLSKASMVETSEGEFMAFKITPWLLSAHFFSSAFISRSLMSS